MKLRNIVAAAILAVMSAAATAPTTAFADVTINGKTYKLSDTDAAKLALDAANKAEQTATPPAPAISVDQVSKYAELGRVVGAGLAGSAKEMGVAVNEFASTPVGILATWLIGYKLIGRDVIGFITGWTWLLVSLPTWFYIFRRSVLIKSVDYVTDEKGKKTKSFQFFTSNDEREGYIVAYLVVLVVIIGIGSLMIFA